LNHENLKFALEYAERGWPVFPMRKDKRPFNQHGRSEATLDQVLIEDWFRRWPDAIPAIATGEECGVVALDIDVSETVNGRDTLEEMGISFWPHTPTAITPRGGWHLLFKHPGFRVKTIAGRLGPGLDIRGDGGSVILPPGPGRAWDQTLHFRDTPLADFPQWAIIKEEARAETRERPATSGPLSRYGEAALDLAVKAIVSAPAGSQEATLNTQAFGIGQLAGGGEIPVSLALDALGWAAGQMPAHDQFRPWNPKDLLQKIERSVLAGMREPRRASA
jgi:putative DNA primase/helicase